MANNDKSKYDELLSKVKDNEKKLKELQKTYKAELEKCYEKKKFWGSILPQDKLKRKRKNVKPGYEDREKQLKSALDDIESQLKSTKKTTMNLPLDDFTIDKLYDYTKDNEKLSSLLNNKIPEIKLAEIKSTTSDVSNNDGVPVVGSDGKTATDANGATVDANGNPIIDTDEPFDPYSTGLEDVEFLEEFVSLDDIGKIPTAEYVKELQKNISISIMGMPYQYPEWIDRPLSDEVQYGRKYTEKIISAMPLLFLAPGEPLFMKGFTKSDKEVMLEAYEKNDENNLTDVVGAKNMSTNPFYVFNSTFDEYCKYVNIYVRSLANFMGLDNEYYIGKERFKNFRLEKMLNHKFMGMFGASVSIPFYLDGENSVSESFSNSTTQSAISSAINGFSDKGREIQFLLGADSAQLYEAFKDLTGSVTSAINTVIGANGNPLKSLTNRITAGINTIVSGGKIVFPEIWGDSDHSRSYSINLKLRSPDPDPVSIMYNIYIPMACLACMTMPRQIGRDANSFMSPFLVRATYKSIFNCEMGIISNLSFNIGGDDKWNSLGQPTAVDVQIDIKDMYNKMFMSKSIGGLLNNVSQLDFLTLQAGIDVNKFWIVRQGKLSLSLFKASVNDIIPNITMGWQSGLNKFTANLLSNVGIDTRYVGIGQGNQFNPKTTLQ